jgi:uncharacterized membrane protein YfcA
VHPLASTCPFDSARPSRSAPCRPAIARLREWMRGRGVARMSLAVLVRWMICELGRFALGVADGDATLLFTIAAIVGLSALMSSIAGFAFAALAGSCFAYLPVEHVDAVQTIVLCSIAIQLYGVWNIRASIRWTPLWPMFAAGMVTVPLGVWVLVHVHGSAYVAGLGVFLTAYGCYAVFCREPLVVRGDAWRDAVAAALGGFAGGLAGLSGSFVTIWCSMRGWDKRQQRAVYQPFILAMQVVTLAWIARQAPSGTHAMQDLRFIPFALIGAVAGLAVFQRITSRQFHAVLSALLIVSGVGLLSRSL